MSLKDASVLVGGTVSATGGTATTFVSKGDSPLSHNLVLDQAVEFAALTRIEFDLTEPKVNAGAPNGYTQARNRFKIISPLALDNGGLTHNTVKVELSGDVEMTDAERDSLRSLAAQILTDPDYDDFWDKQSVS